MEPRRAGERPILRWSSRVGGWLALAAGCVQTVSIGICSAQCPFRLVRSDVEHLDALQIEMRRTDCGGRGRSELSEVPEPGRAKQGQGVLAKLEDKDREKIP